MDGPVAPRLRLRAGRRRMAAILVAATAGLLGAGMATATVRAQVPLPTLPPGQVCLLIICTPANPGGGSGTSDTTPTPTPCPVTCVPPPPSPPCDITNPTSCLASPSPAPPSPTPRQPGHTSSSSSSSSSSSRSSSGTGSFASGLGGGVSGGNGDGGASLPVGVSVAAVPGVQQVSATSGLQFGHAPILWPLFGALDVLGLAAVVIIARRLRSADAD